MKKKSLGLRIIVAIAVLILIAAAIFAGLFLFKKKVPPSAMFEGADPARFAQIYDLAKDNGQLVARFLQLNCADVGDSGEKSGESILLHSPDGKTMLIDAGIPQAAELVLEHLKALGITKLDYMMVSHPHIDHIGGMTQVMDQIEVGEILSSKLVHGTKTYKDFIAYIENKKIPVTYLAEGDTFNFGDKVTMEVFNPEPEIVYYEGFPEGGTQFINNHSLTVKFIYGDVSMLFTGDLYKTGELELAEKYGEKLHADILKVPHHGLDTSSGGTFISTVAPKIAVMTHDTLGSLQVYKNYTKRDIPVLLTYIEGTVRIGTDGKTFEAATLFDRPSDFLN